VVFSERRIQAAFAEAVAFFHSNRIPYMVVGALAVAIWGRSRATADLDFQLHVENMESFLKTLPSAWVFDKKWDLYNPLLREWHKRMLVSGIIVDLMLPRDDFEKKIFSRRIRKKMWNKFVYVVSPEDLLLMKLKAGRPRDFDDAVSIVELQKSLDRSYIRSWVRKLGLHDEAAYIFRDT
jgi:Nucleotidyltransferase of unknown function (DUF6036)